MLGKATFNQTWPSICGFAVGATKKNTTFFISQCQCLISWAWNFKICASPLSWISQCWFFSGGSFMLVSFQQLSFPLFPTVISVVLAIVCFQWTCPFSMVISFLLLEESSSWRHMPTDCPAHKSPWIPPIWPKPLFPQNVFHQIFDITKNVSD